MAELTEKLKIAKEFFNALFAPVPVAAPAAANEDEMPQATLADGTPVNITSLQPGGTVTLLTPEGEVPAPAGKHQLADGTVIVVAEGGVISEVIPAEAPAMMPAEPDDSLEDMKKKVAEMAAKIEEMGKSMDDNKKKMQSQFAEYQTGITKLLEVCEAFASEPAAPADVEVAKRPVFNKKPVPAADKFKAVSNILFHQKSKN